MLAQFC